MPFLQRVRAELRLREPPAPQEVMCYIIGVHVWVGTRSSGQHLPYQNTKGPLHQRGREASLQGLSVLRLLRVFYIRLCSTFSPHLIWRWIFGSGDSRWPSTWRAASPSCGSERCSTLCPTHLWPCRSLPPWPCTTRPAWTQKNETAFLCHKWKEATAAAPHMSLTYMQLRAARSLCTNFFWAKYSIPVATCSPKPIRSFTVGF